MFKGFAQNYINYLTPQMIIKFAAQNNVNLSIEEANAANIFIKKNYKLVLDNYDPELIELLINKNFSPESAKKMLFLVDILRKKFNI